MADLIAIAGESGSGKTTSVKYLNPKETLVISILGKPLPFAGFKKNLCGSADRNFGSVAVIVVHGSISQYSRSSHPAGTIVAAIDHGRQSLNLSRLERTSTV